MHWYTSTHLVWLRLIMSPALEVQPPLSAVQRDFPRDSGASSSEEGLGIRLPNGYQPEVRAFPLSSFSHPLLEVYC